MSICTQDSIENTCVVVEEKYVFKYIPFKLFSEFILKVIKNGWCWKRGLKLNLVGKSCVFSAYYIYDCNIFPKLHRVCGDLINGRTLKWWEIYHETLKTAETCWKPVADLPRCFYLYSLELEKLFHGFFTRYFCNVRLHGCDICWN